MQDLRMLECVQAAVASVMGKEGQAHFNKVAQSRKAVLGQQPKKSLNAHVARLAKMGAKVNG